LSPLGQLVVAQTQTFDVLQVKPVPHVPQGIVPPHPSDAVPQF